MTKERRSMAKRLADRAKRLETDIKTFTDEAEKTYRYMPEVLKTEERNAIMLTDIKHLRKAERTMEEVKLSLLITSIENNEL